MSDNKTKTQVKFVKVNESTAEFTSIVSPKDEGVLTSNGWNKTDGNKWQKDGVILTKLEYAKIVREGAIIHACDYNNPDIDNKYYGKDTLYVDGCQITDIYNTLKPLSNKDRPNTTDVGCIASNEYKLDDLQKMTLGDIFDKIFFPKPKVSKYTVDWGNTHEYWITCAQDATNNVIPARPTLDLNKIVVKEHFETGKGFYIENENQSELIGNDVYTYGTADVDEMHNERTILSYTWDSANNRYNVYNISGKDFVFGSNYDIRLQCYSDPAGDSNKDWIDVTTADNLQNVLPIKENVVDVKLRVLVYKDGNLVYNSNSDDINDNDKGIYGDSNSCPLSVYKNVHDITLNADASDLIYVERDAFDPSKYTYNVRFTDGSSETDIALTSNKYEGTTGVEQGTLYVSKKGPSDDYGNFLNSNYSDKPIMTSAWSKTSANDRRTYGMHNTNSNIIGVKATYRKFSNGYWDEKEDTKNVTVLPLSIDYVAMTKTCEKTQFIRHDNFDFDVFKSPYLSKSYGPFGVTIHYKYNNVSIAADSSELVSKNKRTNVTDSVDYVDSTETGGDNVGSAVDGAANSSYTNTSGAFKVSSALAGTYSAAAVNSATNINGDYIGGGTNKSITSNVTDSGKIYFKFSASALENKPSALSFDEIANADDVQVKKSNNTNENYVFEYTVSEHKIDCIAFKEYSSTNNLIADECTILTDTGVEVYGQLDGDHPEAAAGVASINVNSLTVGDNKTLGTNIIKWATSHTYDGVNDNATEKRQLLPATAVNGAMVNGYIKLTKKDNTTAFGEVTDDTNGHYKLQYATVNNVNTPVVTLCAGGNRTASSNVNINEFSIQSETSAKPRYWNTKTNYLLATSGTTTECVTVTKDDETINYYFKSGGLQAVGCPFGAVDTVFVGLIPKTEGSIHVESSGENDLTDAINYSINNSVNAVKYNDGLGSKGNHYGTFNNDPQKYSYFQKLSSDTDMCTKTDRADHLGKNYGRVGIWAPDSEALKEYTLLIVIPSSVQIDSFKSDDNTACVGTATTIVNAFNISDEQNLANIDTNYKYYMCVPTKVLTKVNDANGEYHLTGKK